MIYTLEHLVRTFKFITWYAFFHK